MWNPKLCSEGLDIELHNLDIQQSCFLSTSGLAKKILNNESVPPVIEPTTSMIGIRGGFLQSRIRCNHLAAGPDPVLC
jgi:hypothetical protein